MNDNELTPREQPDISDFTGEGSRMHVLVATEQEDLAWAVFRALDAQREVRVTACATIAQARHVCRLDPPMVLIIDMGLLSHEPLALVSFANTSREHTHIVALSDHPVFEVGARFGRARLTFMQKPVSAEDLGLLLQLKLEEEPPLPPHVC